MNYHADADIHAILGEGEFRLPDLDPEEFGRLDIFLRADQVVQRCHRSQERPPDVALRAAALAAIDVYDQRTDRLPVGWQKFAVLQAGLAGIELDSAPVMEWAYRLCRTNPGWLGVFDDDIDRGMPLRAMTQQVGGASLYFGEGAIDTECVESARRAVAPPKPSPSRTMGADDLTRLVPELLDIRYPGQRREPDPVEVLMKPNGWALEQEEALCFIRVAGTEHPFIWIKVGAAIAVPKSAELAYRVACVNKDLEAGRAYLGYGEDLALVAIDETVQASALSYEFEPSLEDLTRRFEQSLKQARTLGAEIIDRFGGRRFVRDDLVQLAV
jgi:hypothetical protein